MIAISLPSILAWMFSAVLWNQTFSSALDESRSLSRHGASLDNNHPHISEEKISKPSRLLIPNIERTFPIDDDRRGLPQDGDELVDMQTEVKPNGDINLKFTSHGRRHELELTESRQRLADIPIRLLGASSDFEQQVAAMMKKTRLMRDLKRGATVAFVMDDDNPKPIFKGGMYKLGTHQFDMRSDHNMNKEGKVQVSRNPVNELMMDKAGYTVQDHVLREKRATDTVMVTPISATVELVMILDYSIWNKTFVANDAGSAFDLLLYFGHLAQIVDNHYGAMQNDDIDISVQLAGFITITTPTELAELVENYVYSKTYVNIDDTLSRLATWLGTTNSHDLLPASYDHVMLFTAYDAVDKLYNDKVIGLAYHERICNPTLSCSVVEARRLLTDDASIAAHELGHSLGSLHDGEDGPSKTCAAKNYIMTSSLGGEILLANQFLFSCCSQRSFYGTVARVGSCLLSTTTVPDPNLNDKVTSFLPGQVYTADDQCYVQNETEACGEWVYYQTNSSICLNLWCVSPDDPKYCRPSEIAAADGTTCGYKKWCSQGECVDQSTINTVVDLQCDVRECYTNEKKCANGDNVYDASFAHCYPDSASCDGFSDCSDGTDEANCEKFACPDYYSKCTDGYSRYVLPTAPKSCIPDTWLCDGRLHCSDQSDELNCGVRQATTEEYEWKGTSGKASDYNSAGANLDAGSISAFLLMIYIGLKVAY